MLRLELTTPDPIVTRHVPLHTPRRHDSRRYVQPLVVFFIYLFGRLVVNMNTDGDGHLLFLGVLICDRKQAQRAQIAPGATGAGSA